MFTNALDSRSLRATDTYGQRFMRVGEFAYSLEVAGLPALRRPELAYRVQVVEQQALAERQMRQHVVELEHRDGVFRPRSDEHTTVADGDLVIFTCRDASAPPFQVVGDKAFFGSARLVNESGYAHVFTTPGEHHWVDAYGSGLHGTVRVKDVTVREPQELERWQQQLREAALVLIDEDRVEPQEIDIVLGQTVYFAVVKGPGISITDARLLEAERAANKVADVVRSHRAAGHGSDGRQ